MGRTAWSSPRSYASSTCRRAESAASAVEALPDEAELRDHEHEERLVVEPPDLQGALELAVGDLRRLLPVAGQEAGLAEVAVHEASGSTRRSGALVVDEPLPGGGHRPGEIAEVEQDAAQVDVRPAELGGVVLQREAASLVEILDHVRVVAARWRARSPG